MTLEIVKHVETWFGQSIISPFQSPDMFCLHLKPPHVPLVLLTALGTYNLIPLCRSPPPSYWLAPELNSPFSPADAQCHFLLFIYLFISSIIMSPSNQAKCGGFRIASEPARRHGSVVAKQPGLPSHPKSLLSFLAPSPSKQLLLLKFFFEGLLFGHRSVKASLTGAVMRCAPQKEPACGVSSLHPCPSSWLFLISYSFGSCCRFSFFLYFF